MLLGEVSKYKVLRETNIGYMLESLNDMEDDYEYFLHKNETNYTLLNEGDVVNAFLYMDKLKRPALTLFPPYITVSKGALVKCVSITSIGAYFYIGISKDILLSADEYRFEERPKIGDMLPLKIKVFKNNLYLKMLNKQEILALNDKTHPLAIDEKVKGYIYRITKDGINIVTPEYNIIFINVKNLRGTHHLGEEIECYIIGINEEDYYGTCIMQKEHMIEDDAKCVLDYLTSHKGVMNYTENTDPLVIEHIFHMSKSAYKRALGHLYKENKIKITETKIILVRDDFKI